MTYCDGSLGADGRGQNITGCSSRTIPFSFNATEALLRDVPYDTSLAALGWPDAITGDFRAFALTTRTMSVLYCMGAAMAGAGIMARLGLEIAEKPRRRLAEGSLFLVRCSPIAVTLVVTGCSHELWTGQLYESRHRIDYRERHVVRIRCPHQLPREGVRRDGAVRAEIPGDVVDSGRAAAGGQCSQPCVSDREPGGNRNRGSEGSGGAMT